FAVVHENPLGASTFGIARAREEIAEAPALHGHGLAAFLAGLLGDFRRGRPCRPANFVLIRQLRRDLARAVAVGITGAGEERAVTAQADVHGLSALFAFFLGRDARAFDVIHLPLRQSQVFYEFLIELVERVGPGELAFFDFV